jgi:capsule polysaccharide export protein KpsE/RkpR
VSTSAAHRERVFLEERLTTVKGELDDAAVKFSQFASKNTAIDIKEQGRAMVDAAARLQGELIAAQSQLKGLEEIYMPGNVRVRSVQARIAELQSQLGKMGGTDASISDPAVTSEKQQYPSIRQLPLLGVTYGDLYRRTRIEEAVFETLTQQYELAKVQEAKETPSVKVLDAARVPERKSFPPRGDIALMSALLAFGLASVVVFVRSSWNRADAGDPGKILAKEVFYSVNSHMPWAEPNGSRMQGAAHRVWVRLVRRGNRNSSPDGPAI